MDMEELTIKTEDLMNMRDAAKSLGISRPTLYNRIKQNQLHPVLIGRNRYLLRSEVMALKESNASS